MKKQMSQPPINFEQRTDVLNLNPKRKVKLAQSQPPAGDVSQPSTPNPKFARTNQLKPTSFPTSPFCFSVSTHHSLHKEKQRACPFLKEENTQTERQHS